ncbi:MAG: TRAM domain-containing protein, partial [Chthoniobacterales bacterium]
MKRGAEIELEIVDVAYGGDGIARHEGRVVFVPFAIAGEQVRVRITDVHKSYARAEVRQVLIPSPDRVAPPCPV